jgi:hypothetical protein
LFPVFEENDLIFKQKRFIDAFPGGIGDSHHWADLHVTVEMADGGFHHLLQQF